MLKPMRMLFVLAALALFAAVGVSVWTGRFGAQALTDLASRLMVERGDAARMFMRINGVTGQSKLVVAESSTVVTGAYESSKAVLGVDLGTTALTFEVPVRFFYAVDLSGEAPVEFVVEPETGVLLARFPALQLFSTEPDLGKLNQQVEVGWGRLERFSGEDVRKRFRERVMSDLRARGSDVASVMAVRVTARKRLEAMTRSFLEAYAPDAAGGITEIRVRFADEPPPGR